MNKNTLDTLQDISEEIALELSDMLAVALYFAGVKKECTQKAMEAYLEELDHFDEDLEYNQEAIIEAILNIKKKHKDFFH